MLTSVLPCSHLDKSSVDMKSTEMKVYYILYFSSYSFVSWQKKTNAKMLPFWEKWVANNLYINPALSLWLHRYTDFTCIKVLIWKVKNGTLVNFDIAHSNGCLCNVILSSDKRVIMKIITSAQVMYYFTSAKHEWNNTLRVHKWLFSLSRVYQTTITLSYYLFNNCFKYNFHYLRGW